MYDQTAPASWPAWLLSSNNGVLGISTFNATSNAVSVSTAGYLTLAISTVIVNGAPMYMVPAGAMMFFTGTSCPKGWTDFASNFTGYPSTSLSFYPVIRGRPAFSTGTFTSSPYSGTSGITQQGLQNFENRPTGQHAHSASFNHNHYLGGDDTGDYGAGTNVELSPNNDNSTETTYTDGPIVNNSSGASGVPGTNAPYYQLLLCQKN
jgi:hypothetical protein